MQEALRRRPLEKRHSKPCKFYQTMSCPLAADVCDFAHVLVDPASLFRINDTCRYYQSGYCANGPLCRFAHTVEVSSPTFSDVNKISSPVVEQRSPAIYMSAPPVISNGTPTLDLAFANLSISSCVSPPLAKPRLFSNTSYPTLPSPTVYSDLDDFAMCTEDPQMSEHSHAHQSRVYITDAISPVHVSPFQASLPHRCSSSFSPLSPHFEVQSSLFMVESNFVTVQQPEKKRRSRGVSKKRLAKYKTKPCKFFFGSGMCPNGDNCSFIHGENAETLRRIHFNRAASKRDEGALGSSENAGESNRGDDDQTSQADSSEFQTPLLLSQLVINADLTNGSGERNIKGRPRANSIPSTPSASSQMGMEYRFPAESPAIL